MSKARRHNLLRGKEVKEPKRKAEVKGYFGKEGKEQFVNEIVSQGGDKAQIESCFILQKDGVYRLEI